MAEFNQFSITIEANEVADKFIEAGWFSNVNEAGRFAAAYTIKNHFHEVDPATLYYPSTIHNHGYASFDPDGSWEIIIKNLYNTETPRLLFKNLIIWGLETMGEKINANGFLLITDFV